MEETSLQRMELLIGQHNLLRLKQSTVMIVGIGGVGSYAAEALARSGVGTLILVDGDTVAISNLNRQIHATYETLQQQKTEAMKHRILSFNKECHIINHNLMYDAAQNEHIFCQSIDFVIDAIDTMSCKIDLITYCLQHKIPFISCLGMANRLDPTQITITELMKTSYDPVAKIMRNMVRKNKLKGRIPVLFSVEHPMVQTKVVNENGVTRKQKIPPASSSFVPGAAGLAAASYVVRALIKKYDNRLQK